VDIAAASESMMDTTGFSRPVFQWQMAGWWKPRDRLCNSHYFTDQKRGVKNAIWEMEYWV
jgi:hypothetical protein